MKNAWPVHLGVLHSEEQPGAGDGSGLEVIVIYTGAEPTLRALRRAAGLAADLGARVHLLVPEIVPFPAPVDEPLVDREFAEQKVRELVKDLEIDTTVDLFLCREPEAVLSSLKPRSVVVVGSRKFWWRSHGERRLMRALRRDGHHVLSVQFGRGDYA